MHCERCKAINKDGAAFCRECGNPLTGLLDSLGGADTLVGEDDGPGGYVPPTPSGPGTVDKDGRIVSLGDSDTLGGASFMAEAGYAADLSTGDLDLEEGAGAPVASSEEEFGFTDTLADRFELLEKLGEGGMGVVYKARDRRLRRLVALKRLTARTRENRRAIERFRTEATTVASLDHAGIVRIYNLIEDERGICLELEFVGGGDLQSRLDRDGALPVEEACDIVAQLCDAVSVAHEQGLVHRDIKPANVLLTPRGTPKLSDFGLARAAESGRTVTGSLMGTLLYAAPEQLVSGKHVDERSDIYALGATLYALVTGEAPRTIRLERVPVAIREAVGKCLEENPAKRYQTAQEVKEALESAVRRASRIAATACPACGSENPLDARFCQQCGGNLSSLFRTCPQCGKESRRDVEFCGGCGTHLARHFAVLELLGKARQLRDGHNYAEALPLCEKALKLDPDQAEAGALAAELRGVLATIAERLDAAEKAEDAGRLEDAVACYEEVLQLDPGHEGAEGSVSRLREAIAESERKARAKQGRILIAEMKEAQNRHDYERAIEKCRTILELYPTHPHAGGHLEQLKQKRILQLAEEVRSAKRAGDWDLVEARCRTILEIEPEQRDTREYLKRTVVPALLRKAAEANDISQARALCARAEGLVPDDAAILEHIEHLKERISAEEARAVEQRKQQEAAEQKRRDDEARRVAQEEAWRVQKRKISVTGAVVITICVLIAGVVSVQSRFRRDAVSEPHPQPEAVQETPGTAQQAEAAALKADEERRQREAAAARRTAFGPGSRAGETRTVDLGGGVLLDLVWIPPGEFVMGSPSSEAHRYDNEGPQHRVQITQGFWMGKYEVTQAQWQTVMGNNPSRFKGDRDPVEEVSWNDCQEFVKKLSQKAGVTFRMPTEAEWEYACRAGSTTAYCFGDDASRLGEYAWYDWFGDDASRLGEYPWYDESRVRTHPVGQKKPNAWGLYDMQGNVWEWCGDWFGDYPSGAVTDPRGPSSGSLGRVYRGCSYLSYPGDCRSAIRGGSSPEHRGLTLGFRVALPAVQSSP